MPQLQQAIARGRAPSFEHMADSGRGAFSGKNGGLLCATARYLCFHLQERGQLIQFYRAFRARVSADGKGLATLQDTTAKELKTPRAEWETFVARL